MICSSGLVCFLLGCLEGNENSQDRESLLHFFFSKNLDCFGGQRTKINGSFVLPEYKSQQWGTHGFGAIKIIKEGVQCMCFPN